MPKKKLLWWVLHFQPVTVRSCLTPTNEEGGAPRQPSAAPRFTFAEGCLHFNSLTLCSNHSWHPKYETEWTLGVLILSRVLFSTAGFSGTESKKHPNPEHNSWQYSLLNNKAESLPKDFFWKKCFERGKGWRQKTCSYLLEHLQLIWS